MQILMIDHLDSFSQTLAASFRSCGAEVDVVSRGRDDSFSLDELTKRLPLYDGLVLSPGPGHPQEYLKTCPLELLNKHWPQLPIFGVCLGLQQMLQHSGAIISPLEERPIHGRVDPLTLAESLPSPFHMIPASTPVVSYNSLGATPVGMANASEQWDFVLSSRESACVNLACHRDRPWVGVQFHPESFATPDGHLFIECFLHWVQLQKAAPTANQFSGSHES